MGVGPGPQGGYFIVNGSEKVLIAQERMANNHVAVYRKRDHKYSTVAECRCGRPLHPRGSLRICSCSHARLRRQDTLHPSCAVLEEGGGEGGDWPRLVPPVSDHNVSQSDGTLHRCIACRTLQSKSSKTCDDSLPAQQSSVLPKRRRPRPQAHRSRTMHALLTAAGDEELKITLTTESRIQASTTFSQ